MSQGLSTSHPPPAAPPTRLEIERKLSFKSASVPSPRHGHTNESPKKKWLQQNVAPNLPVAHPVTGNESDTSSVTSSQAPTFTLPMHHGSPLLSPTSTSIAGLSSIAERKAKIGGAVAGDDFDEMELAALAEEGEEEGEGSQSEMEERDQELQRDLDGERMVKSGYLWKKQERLKAWKKKWFVLRTGKLAYYKDDKEYSLSRVIDLRSVQTVAPVTVKKHSFTFGIVTSKRTFFAEASSPDEMEEWVRAINGARRKLSERAEEDRNKRERPDAAQNKAVNIPARDRGEPVDAHIGSHSSGVSAMQPSSSSSPQIGTGYFAPRQQAGGPSHLVPIVIPTSPVHGLQAVPLTPLDTTNSLTSRIASMGISPSPTSGSVLHLGRATLGISTQPSSRVVSAASTRREPSAASMVSSGDLYGVARSPSGTHPALLTPTLGGGVISSDEEGEDYFSDPRAAFLPGTSLGMQMQSSQISGSGDPNKTILSSYLMKRSKGRGRRLWHKRWFVLTSQGLTYTKSHMDSRPLRFIPLTSVLDALEIDPGDATSSSDSDDASIHGEHSPPSRQPFSASIRSRQNPVSEKKEKAKSSPKEDEHIFRLVTAKRTYVLCAPSEEDEIKWLAAFQALLRREREKSQGGGPPLSPASEFAPRLPTMLVPTIMQQPPTPATPSIPSNIGISGGGISAASGGMATGLGLHTAGGAEQNINARSISASHGPPVLEREVGPGSGITADTARASQGQRGRSATYTAKSAVAEVVRRFQAEQRKEGEVH